MLTPPVPIDEEERLKTLRELNILDTPVEERFEHITRITKSLFNVPIVTISLIDEKRQWLKSAQGLNKNEEKREVSFCAHAILQDDVFEVTDAQTDPRFLDNPLVTGAPNIRFYAGYPIRAKNSKKLGTLCIIDNRPRQLSEEESLRLKDMAALVESEIEKNAMSCAQAQLIAECDQAKRASLIDPLTHLWNREGIMRILQHQLSHNSRSKQVFGLAIADIDHFKQVNDQYGHNAGDEVLRAVTCRFVSSCRNEDAVGRWGGEEFIMVINAQKSQEILEIAERFHTNVANNPVKIDEKNIPITVTIGISLVDPKIAKTTLENSIETADQALYQGKNNGRNQVTVAW